MLGLGLGPAAEQRIVDCHHLDRLQPRDVGRIGGGGIVGAIEVLRDDLLAGGRIEMLEIGLGGFDLDRCPFLGIADDDGDRRLGLDRQRGVDDLVFVLRLLFRREEAFILPRDENVARALLGEGGGGAARARDRASGRSCRARRRIP